MNRTVKIAAVLFLFGVLLIRNLLIAGELGQTVDETYYIATGYPAVKHQDYSFLGEHPPLISQLGAVPLLFFKSLKPLRDPVLKSDGAIDTSRSGSDFLYKSTIPHRKLLFFMRLPVVLLSCMAALFVWLWSRALFGDGGGLLSLFFYVFSPNLTAHGSIYTTDLGVAAFILGAFYMMWRYSRSGRLMFLACSGIFFGLAMVSKMSAIVMVPVLIGLLIADTMNRTQFPDWNKGPAVRKVLLTGIPVGLLILSMGHQLSYAAIVPLYLLFFAPDVRLKDLPRSLWFKKCAAVCYAGAWAASIACAGTMFFKFRTGISIVFCVWNAVLFALSVRQIFQKKASGKMFYFSKYMGLYFTGVLAVIILTYTDFPYMLARVKPFAHFLTSFLAAFAHVNSPHVGCVAGSFIQCDWTYFTLVGLIKIPVVFMLFSAAGTLCLLARKDLRYEKGCLLIAPVFFLLAASVFSRIYIGLRHVLPILPFMAILAGASVLLFRYSGKRIRMLLAAGLLLALPFQAATQAARFPDYLAYFNGLVRGGVEEGVNLVADSNLNWGQDNDAMARWMADEKVPVVKIASATSNAELYDAYHLPWSYAAEEELREPSPGTYAVGIEFLKRRNSPPGYFHGKTPLKKIGNTYYIFSVEG